MNRPAFYQTKLPPEIVAEAKADPTWGRRADAIRLAVIHRFKRDREQLMITVRGKAPEATGPEMRIRALGKAFDLPEGEHPWLTFR